MIVQKWDTHEVELHSTAPYENPFTDVEVTATVSCDGGKSYETNGFFDGEGIWRIRFMPDEVGSWSYRTHSSDTALDGAAGTIRCVDPTESYLRGPIKCRDNHFFHADGSVCPQYAVVLPLGRTFRVAGSHRLSEREPNQSYPVHYGWCARDRRATLRTGS